MDLETAIAKAKEEGVTSLSVNEDLKGKTRSWESVEVYAYDYKDFEFRGGKYDTLDIRESNDLSYLNWYSNERDSLVAMQRVVELDDTKVIFDDYLISKTDLVQMELTSKILTGGIELEAISNFRLEPSGYYSVRVVIANPSNEAEEDFNYRVNDSWNLGRFEVNISGRDLVKKSFRGNSYYTLNNQRSFKGTKLTLTANELDENDYESNEMIIK